MTDKIWILTRFENESEAEKFSHDYGIEGDAQTRLRSITDLLWMDYAIRQGHVIHVPVKKPPLGLRADNPWHIHEQPDFSTIEPDWMQYCVYLASDTTNTPLDLSKTLGELGLTERKVWVRFERAI